MTPITSQAHSETISGWSPIGPLVSGMGSSLAFTILTGLAERPVFPLPSAFRTGYGPRCLSAQGQSRDLRHFSPMPTRYGNSVLRDMAHMVIRPVNTGIPHQSCSSLYLYVLSTRALLLWRSQRDSLMIGSAQEQRRESASFLNRSSRVEQVDFSWRIQQLYRTSVSLFQPYVERACS